MTTGANGAQAPEPGQGGPSGPAADGQGADAPAPGMTAPHYAAGRPRPPSPQRSLAERLGSWGTFRLIASCVGMIAALIALVLVIVSPEHQRAAPVPTAADRPTFPALGQHVAALVRTYDGAWRNGTIADVAPRGAATPIDYSHAFVGLVDEESQTVDRLRERTGTDAELDKLIADEAHRVDDLEARYKAGKALGRAARIKESDRVTFVHDGTYDGLGTYTTDFDRAGFETFARTFTPTKGSDGTYADSGHAFTTHGGVGFSGIWDLSMTCPQRMRPKAPLTTLVSYYCDASPTTVYLNSHNPEYTRLVRTPEFIDMLRTRMADRSIASICGPSSPPVAASFEKAGHHDALANAYAARYLGMSKAQVSRLTSTTDAAQRITPEATAVAERIHGGSCR